MAFTSSRRLFARTKTGDSIFQQQDDTPLPIADLMLLKQLPKGPKLKQTLRLFRGENAETIHKEIGYFVKSETGAREVYILRMYGEEFEVVDTKKLQTVTHSCKKVSGMSDAVYKRLPILLEKDFTAPWKGILKAQPEYLFLIPITVYTSKSMYIMATVLLAYYAPIPRIMEEETTWHVLLDYLQLTVPLLINVLRYEESDERRQRYVDAYEAIARAERDIHDMNNCIKTLAYEIGKFLNVKYVQVFSVHQEVVEEKKLHKYCSLGQVPVSNKCPMPSFTLDYLTIYCHESDEIEVDINTCVGYVTMNGKSLRVNTQQELTNYGIKANHIHAIGGCVVNNILCMPLSGNSGEIPLIMELSEKSGGFSTEDEEQAEMFFRRSAAILSSAVLLDYKKKAIRRHGIRNEVLANIGEVSYFKVNQLLDLKFDFSSSFRKKFLDFSFSMRLFPDHQSPSVILYMFVDLGFIQRWNMRRSTLIRFILSMQQGYRDIPYHNWKHACCVTHYIYLLVKKLDLVKLGYLTDLEALTLMISALAHDVDHRGRNNHFNLCTKSELYHLYKQEDSIMERHHIAVALSVLNSEDCNILQNLQDSEYKEFLELIQWNIMDTSCVPTPATDLSRYMQNKHEYIYTLSHFDQTDLLHRKHFSAMAMTTADLCDHIKAWDINLNTIKSIFREFFAQGDDEIALGLKPMPMMDRRIAYIPQIEIQFINTVVRPAYHALADLLPPTRVCVRVLDYHVDLWLIATAVFDENSHIAIGDPLQILELAEMKEKNLRKRSVPNLQEVLDEHGIAPMSIAHIGIKTNSATSISSLPLGGIASSESIQGYEQMEEEKRRSSLPLPPNAKHEKLSCYAMTKNWLCCYICRNRGLVTARAVRQYRLEDTYLDKRVNQYETRPGSGVHEQKTPSKQIY